MSEKFLQIPTKASLSKDLSDVDEDKTQFTVVVHKKRERKVKAKVPGQEKSGTDEPESEFDIKRARHDVIRFGASGLDAKEKKNAQIALAVKLGAKPPKKVHKNLKEFHEERKLAAAKSSKDNQDLGLKAKQITNFHCNQLISTAQRRKQRKRNDTHNTIGGYGKVTKTKV